MKNRDEMQNEQKKKLNLSKTENLDIKKKLKKYKNWKKKWYGQF